VNLRTKNKLTQEQVAELIGRDLRTVQNHEGGVNEPSGPVLKRYAQLYNVHWLEIKTGHAPPPGIVSELPPLYGRTSEVKTETGPVKVTEFAPGEEHPPESPLKGGMTAGEREALFYRVVAANDEKDREIARLRTELQDVKNKLAVVRHIFLKYHGKPKTEHGTMVEELSYVLDLKTVNNDGGET
jgi:transcriptional regulator with XRE-family HTH domain